VRITDPCTNPCHSCFSAQTGGRYRFQQSRSILPMANDKGMSGSFGRSYWGMSLAGKFHCWGSAGAGSGAQSGFQCSDPHQLDMRNRGPQASDQDVSTGQGPRKPLCGLWAWRTTKLAQIGCQPRCVSGRASVSSHEVAETDGISGVDGEASKAGPWQWIHPPNNPREHKMAKKKKCWR
jgi:hypothetical protein